VTSSQSLRSIAGADIQVESIGSGPTLLYLHGQDGTIYSQPLLEQLAQNFTVIAPAHPGWAGSPRTGQFRTLDDIAYLYLALLAEQDGPIPVVGTSLGAWLAMEIATKSTQQISSLSLISPVGIRAGDATTRYYLDTYASPPETVLNALYADPSHRPDMSEWSDDQFMALAQANESATYFIWEPYLNNPSLLYRLPLVTVPTLIVTGEQDGLVLADDHVKTLSSAFGAAVETASIPAAAHRVDEEQPAQLAETITSFVRRQS
jgi:pimeloyl-ACP methyl ester carboxylesterase